MRYQEGIYHEDAENSTTLVNQMSFYQTYKKHYSSDPFGDTTIEAGTRLVDKIMGKKKKIWEVVIIKNLSNDLTTSKLPCLVNSNQFS